MEKNAVKKFIQKKLNIPITPENVYTSLGKHNATADADTHTHTHTHTKNAKYLDELYSAAFMDDYFS
jgi:hypothetical protein